jgi:nucleoside-diphosphate-sugar epimerase
VNRRIRVFGGSQLRPNIHIADMVAAYEVLLDAPRERVHGEVFNAGYENRSVHDLALTVKRVIGDATLPIDVEPSNDLRSYHISSEKIGRILGFTARHAIEDAVRSLTEAYERGAIPRPFDDPSYYNVKRMKLMTTTSTP